MHSAWEKLCLEAFHQFPILPNKLCTDRVTSQRAHVFALPIRSGPQSSAHPVWGAAFVYGPSWHCLEYALQDHLICMDFGQCPLSVLWVASAEGDSGVRGN